MATLTLRRSVPMPAAPRFSFARLGGGLRTAWRRFTTRRDLAEMDDRMLKDLGISRAQAQFEANRPIWR